MFAPYLVVGPAFVVLPAILGEEKWVEMLLMTYYAIPKSVYVCVCLCINVDVVLRNIYALLQVQPVQTHMIRNTRQQMCTTWSCRQHRRYDLLRKVEKPFQTETSC